MTFTVARSFRVFVTLMACGVPAILFGALIANGQSVAHAALFAVPFAIGLVWLYLEVKSKVTVDDQGIVYYRLGRRISIPWAEIDELHYSPRLLSIGSAWQRARMKFFRGEYGASLEPFDALRAEVQRRVERRLTETWERLALPVRYRYRGLSVSRLVVREPPSIGWGSLTIEACGGRAIWVPRWLPEIGAIFYLVRKHSDAPEAYGHEI